MVIVLPNRNCLVYRWLYCGSYINMNITELEKEIVKAIKIEDKDIKKSLDAERPLDDLKGLIKFVRKLFKEYRED